MLVLPTVNVHESSYYLSYQLEQTQCQLTRNQEDVVDPEEWLRNKHPDQFKIYLTHMLYMSDEGKKTLNALKLNKWI